MFADPARAGRAAVSAALAGTVRIPAGSYQPLYGVEGARIPVAGFALDRFPVTRGQYRRFLEDHPKWRRAVNSAALASTTDLADKRRPLTDVPREAAEAYCEAQGMRLPTTDEWEYAAAASETRRDGSRDAAFQQRLLELYTRPRPGTPAPVGSTFRNAFGVYDLHGLVWEWTADAASPPPPPEHPVLAHGQGALSMHASGHHDLGCAGSAVGATDTRAYAAFLRYAFRAGLSSSTRLPTLGFRCAR